MTTIWILLSMLGAYLLGSIPTAVWYGLKYHDVDVRTLGSKNAGATNTFRVLGRKAGIIVLIIDAAKGYWAAQLPYLLLSQDVIGPEYLVRLQLAAGLFAVVGHIFPVFAGFKGGKGVATVAGMMLGIHPVGVGICLLIFLLILILTHYVSLGSMLAAIAFPILLATRALGEYDATLLIFGCILSCGIVYTHKKNIKRLLKGEEGKIYLFGQR